jgi:mono/diheme cytochrome c family protein
MTLMMSGREVVVAVALSAMAGAALSRPLRQGAAEMPSAATLALGDSVYHGKVGGALCYVCHGPAGKGVPGIGPNLTDKEWLNADGSIGSIAKVVEEGVAKPKKMPAPMPPKGGGQLTDTQIKAVAAYVHALSQPKH